jgi:hypothetical protein
LNNFIGNTAARTGDAQTSLTSIFNKDQVKQDVAAQVAITSEFGKQASKAVGDYAGKTLTDLKQQASNESDPTKKAALLADAAKWEEGGASRVALHTVVGGLTGGVQGAVGAGTASAAAPSIDELQGKLQDGLKSAGLGDSAAKTIASLVSGATAAGIGAAASGGSTAGAATAFNADMNNRQLHPTEIQKAKELAAKSGGKYTQAQIEEQMRLMGNDQFKESPNTMSALVGGQAVRASVNADPGMPKAIQGEVAIEIPGQANSGLQQFIQANTKDAWIPGASPYTSSDLAKNSPVLSNRGPDLTTSKCANVDITCTSGVGAQQSAPLSQQAKEAIADGASSVSRQAGVIGAVATTATAAAPPQVKPITGSVAVGATVIGVAADAVEQMARPDAKQVFKEQLLLGVPAEVLIQRYPQLATLINEVKEALK